MILSGPRLICFAFFCLPFFIHGQKFHYDSSFIKEYEKNNVAELYGGDYSTHFNFSDPKSYKSNFRLAANSSGYLGVYVNYKWASLKYSFAIPGTELDRDTKFKYTSLRYRFSGRKKIFHLFYDTYNGFLIPVENIKDSFRVFEDISFRNMGVDFYYYFNAKKYSYYAANNFSERQIKSAGSLFIMLTPMLNKIKWKNPSRDLITDSLTYDVLSSNPKWFSFAYRLGYTYNFAVKQGKWSIVPALLLGIGFRKELTTYNNGIQLVTDIRAHINAGYNGDNFYYYLTAKWGNLQTNLLVKNMHQVDQNISLTAGYRFRSLKKKILGIL